MIRSLFALSGAVSLFAVSAVAQVVAIAPAPVSTLMVAGPADNMLRTGQPIQLKMAEGLTTKGKNLRVGYHFQMEVAEAVSVNGQVVIPVGTPATGEVTEVRNKGMWGKSGHLTASILYLRVNDRQIRLSGTFDDKGVTGTAGVVAAIAFVPVVGFFTTGTSAEVPLGAQVKGFLAEDVPLTFAKAGPAPMVVAPVAAVPVAPAAATPMLPAQPVTLPAAK